MSEMEDKPLADQATAPYKTAAEDHPGIKARADQPAPRPGLSVSPGLRPLPDSFAQDTARGEKVQHTFGPQQSPVDPNAAGLDTAHDPMTRAENRMITRADGSIEPAKPDAEQPKATGPGAGTVEPMATTGA